MYIMSRNITMYILGQHDTKHEDVLNFFCKFCIILKRGRWAMAEPNHVQYYSSEAINARYTGGPAGIHSFIQILVGHPESSQASYYYQQDYTSTFTSTISAYDKSSTCSRKICMIPPVNKDYWYSTPDVVFFLVFSAGACLFAGVCYNPKERSKFVNSSLYAGTSTYVCTDPSLVLFVCSRFFL